MAEQNNFVLLKILDKEFRVTCQPEEKEMLLESASYLSNKMKTLRARGKVVGNDRVAITAALNVSHELHECRQQLAETSDNQEQSSTSNLNALRKKIDAALNGLVNQNEFSL